MKKAKKPKARKGAWFVKVRGSYLPASRQGWLTYIPYVSFLCASMIYVNQTASTVIEIPIRILPYWVSTAIVMHWVASRNS